MYYATGTGPAYLAFRIGDQRGLQSYHGPVGYVSSFTGMTTTGSAATGYTVAGTTSFTLNIPITFGVATDITFGLWAAVLPSSSLGMPIASGGAASFLSTARLTGIEVLGPTGLPLPTVSIVSASGTVYGPGGVVSSVPEPAGAALMLLGLLLLLPAVQAQRRARSQAACTASPSSITASA